MNLEAESPHLPPKGEGCEPGLARGIPDAGWRLMSRAKSRSSSCCTSQAARAKAPRIRQGAFPLRGRREPQRPLGRRRKGIPVRFIRADRVASVPPWGGSHFTVGSAL
jgi:hypothetical protein